MFPEFGVRDKSDNNSGFISSKSNKKETTVRDNLVFVDSRDCVGIQSIKDAKTYATGLGLNDNFTARVITTTGVGVSPVVISIKSYSIAGLVSFRSILNDGDIVIISDVQGNKSVNGTWKITNVLVDPDPLIPVTFEILEAVSSGNYAGSGIVTRPADPGFPRIKNNANIIVGNEMTIYLPKKLKSLRSISLVHTVIPRDIIPLNIYLPDFVSFSQFVEASIPSCPTVRVATTAAGTLATDFEIGDTIDGVVLVLNDRILIKNQASADENGIYIVQASLIRSNDLPDTTPSEAANNYYVVVSEGTVNEGLTYIITMAGGGQVGTDNMTLTNIPAGIPISWASYIPQEEKFLNENIIGFYSTPLQLFRTYFDSPFSIPNNNTPPPLRLWNPTVGGATHQLQPYPQQTVPTYTSDTFVVTIDQTGEQPGLFYLILSGYGLYDLHDWTYRLNADDFVNYFVTSLMRIMLLLTIALNQTLRDIDYVDLILNSQTANDLDPLVYYGYGSFQRFLPGPGLGMSYQPGTSDGADPTVTRTDSPVPFPYYRGNVWGPYSSPGDRFQRMGLRDTVQDLFLNGDLSNLFGVSIIKPWVTAKCISSDISYGINFPAFSFVTFGNILDSTNPNITNAMRLSSNGFGALSVNNLGNDSTYTEKFLNAGGQGPDPPGIPIDGYSSTPGGGSWVTTEVIDGGTGQFDDAIAAGPQYANTATNTTSSGADATYTGDDGTPKITRQTAWYDSGSRNGDFKNQMFSYRNWIITELPDTNLLITVFQAQRNQRVQSSNQTNTTAIFNCPIRLNLGTNTGTREYVESVESLLASSQLYWDNRFLPSDESLYKLTLSFTAFDGIPIPLEKMLQFRRSVTLQQTYNTIVEPFKDIIDNVSTTILRKSKVQSVFDPLDPRLFKRLKRNIGLIFKIETYEHDNPGLYAGIADNGNDDSFVTANSIY
jgi:hypothetical protein